MILRRRTRNKSNICFSHLWLPMKFASGSAETETAGKQQGTVIKECFVHFKVTTLNTTDSRGRLWAFKQLQQNKNTRRNTHLWMKSTCVRLMSSPAFSSTSAKTPQNRWRGRFYVASVCFQKRKNMLKRRRSEREEIFYSWRCLSQSLMIPILKSCERKE